MKNIILSNFFILLFSIIGLSQSNSLIEDGWKGIKPLEIDKAKVNKLLGTPEIDDNEYYNYRTDEAFIHMTYATAPCEKDNLGRGEYNVAKNTVLKYAVSIKNVIKLSDMQFNKEKYRRVKNEEQPNLADYYDNENGIEISVWIQEGIEYIGTIYYKPSKQKEENFKCKNILCGR
jgi:hypothetical protein